MTNLAAVIDPRARPAPIGLIVLQPDETFEPEFHRAAQGWPNPVYTTRIPSAPEVRPDSLRKMAGALAESAGLLPKLDYAVVGYGCTSASAVIGADAVAEAVRQGCQTAAVTNPMTALLARAADLGVSRFAMVSPYIDSVVAPLRQALAAEGLSTDVTGNFGIAEEQKVARITTACIVEAGMALGQDDQVEAVFLSCTNLRTQQAIVELEARLKKPVVSSNSALIWHVRALVDAQKSDSEAVMAVV